MPPKRLAAGIAFTLVLLAAAAGLLLFGVRQTPEFYEQALRESAEPAVRREEAKRLTQQALRLVDGIRYEDRWAEEFHERHVNAWIAEELHTRFAEWVPPGIEEPRVRFTEKVIHVGFRARRGGLEGVVTLRLRPWMLAPNRLGVAVEDVKLGAVPIPLDELLEKVARQFETEHWRVRWSQSAGTDVLVVDFQGHGPDSPTLEAIEVGERTLRVAGRGGGQRVARHGQRPLDDSALR